jgi:hypothetical protein
VQTENGLTFFTVTNAGLTWAVFFYGCEASGCGEVQFSAVVPGAGATLDKVNAWNRDNRYLKAFHTAAETPTATVQYDVVVLSGEGVDATGGPADGLAATAAQVCVRHGLRPAAMMSLSQREKGKEKGPADRSAGPSSFDRRVAYASEAVDVLAGLQQALDRGDRLFEHRLFFVVGGELDDLLDAAGADQGRDADIEVRQAVFARQPDGAGQDALLVQQVGLGHGDRRFRRSVEGRAGLQQGHDLAAALAGALDDGVQLVLRQEAGGLTASGRGRPPTVEWRTIGTMSSP